MKDVIRVILIDPLPESRHGLHAMLSASPEFWVADVFNTYENAVRRVLEVNADLVIVAIDADPVAGVRLVQALTRECPRAVTVPASMTRDSSIILQVVRAGAREFLTLPIARDAFVATVGRLFEGREEAKPEAERGPHIIATAGAAGGVGCTSIAVNLAATLAKTSGHETLLADFDLLLGTVDACLDIVTTRTLLDVTQNIARLDLTLLKRSVTQHSSGLYVLPHPAAFEDAAKIDPETLRRVLSLFKSAYATIVIDTSKGLQATDFLAYESADVILVVTQLDLTCLRNTARLLDLFRQFDNLIDRVKLVVNRVGQTENEISLKKAEETLKLPIAWQLANAQKTFQNARMKGVTIEAEAPGSRSHQVFLDMAQKLRPFPVVEITKQRRGLFAALF